MVHCRRVPGVPAGKPPIFMLFTIAVILLVLWLLGMVTGTMIGGFIHILLVVAIVMVLVRIITGKKPL
jgi:hypothetical protein